MGYEEFSTWYAKGGNGSGPGSSPDATGWWRDIVSSRLGGVRTVVDLGCGDWQHSSLIDWGEVRYVGIDVVPDLITHLRESFGGPRRDFYLLDPMKGAGGLAELLATFVPEGAELVICKDVLQHLSNEESLLTVDALRRLGGDLLLVNDMNEGVNNRDMEVGGCRHIDPRQPPFSLEAELIVSQSNGKTVFLVKGG